MKTAHIAIIIGAIALAFGAYFFLFSKPAHITNYPSSGTDIVAFGDSLVAGNGATEGHDFVSVLSDKIGQPIINLGVPGNTTAQGLARISQLNQYKPKVVVLLLGGNDRLQNVSPEETFANLSTIIEELQKRGAIVLLLGIRGSILNDKYAGQFEALAKKYHTAYVTDVLSGLFGHQEYMSDEVHPNDAGYAIIANRIESVLVPLLR